MIKIIENTSYKVLPCPVCSSEDIKVKVQLQRKVQTDSFKASAWAYCDSCHHRGLTVTGVFHDDNEILNAAYTLWNREK